MVGKKRSIVNLRRYEGGSEMKWAPLKKIQSTIDRFASPINRNSAKFRQISKLIVVVLTIAILLASFFLIYPASHVQSIMPPEVSSTPSPTFSASTESLSPESAPQPSNQSTLIPKDVEMESVDCYLGCDAPLRRYVNVTGVSVRNPRFNAVTVVKVSIYDEGNALPHSQEVLAAIPGNSVKIIETNLAGNEFWDKAGASFYVVAETAEGYKARSNSIPVDSLRPSLTVTLNSPQNQTYTSNTITISVSAFDLKTQTGVQFVAYIIDDGPPSKSIVRAQSMGVQSLTGEINRTLSDGTHKIVGIGATRYGADGAFRSEPVYFTIDTSQG